MLRPTTLSILPGESAIFSLQGQHSHTDSGRASSELGILLHTVTLRDAFLAHPKAPVLPKHQSYQRTMQTHQPTPSDQSTELGISPESHNTDVGASGTQAVSGVVDVSGTNNQPTPSNEVDPSLVTAYLQAVREAQTRVANGRGDPLRLLENDTEVNTFFSSDDFRLIEEDFDITTGEKLSW
ncbi:hypothetical protein BC937DRAFT_89811 [Endogone sp. FLAS-F59071]|nr:hypothetical protein BC937DRAFT_89811 [Endogone sp. FLAS-F59071]|eukprot:RUS17562.1 hypothetical protein BC937DRAFT_89811 [Endogone sp. FLAS-F59071]